MTVRPRPYTGGGDRDLPLARHGAGAGGGGGRRGRLPRAAVRRHRCGVRRRARRQHEGCGLSRLVVTFKHQISYFCFIFVLGLPSVGNGWSATLKDGEAVDFLINNAGISSPNHP